MSAAELATKDARADQAPPPYDVMGGAPVLGRVVERFYDLMDR